MKAVLAAVDAAMLAAEHALKTHDDLSWRAEIWAGKVADQLHALLTEYYRDIK